MVEATHALVTSLFKMSDQGEGCDVELHNLDSIIQYALSYIFPTSKVNEVVVRMMTTKKPSKTTFILTPLQFLQYSGNTFPVGGYVIKLHPGQCGTRKSKRLQGGSRKSS